LQHLVETEADMVALGAALGRRVSGACVVFLTGDLGAGKTTLARGLLQALGHQGVVTSPTFTLMETYPFVRLTVVHVDLYRLEDPAELEQLAIRDYVDEQAVLMVEWADRARDYLPAPDCEVQIAVMDNGQRCVRTESLTAAGAQLCTG